MMLFIWRITNLHLYLYNFLKLGHVDFYPNAGQHPQPGCEGEGLDLDCSHQRAPVSGCFIVNPKI